MIVNTKVDEIAAGFFRNVLKDEDKVKNFAAMFLNDLDSNVSSEESFKTMDLWQKFLRERVGFVDHLSKEELKDLNRVVRGSGLSKSSMITQSLSGKFGQLIDMVETPLHSKHSVFMPRIDTIV